MNAGGATDCPQREKNGWTGDGHFAIEAAFYNFDGITVYEKWLADHRDEQQPNGVLPDIIPTGTLYELLVNILAVGFIYDDFKKTLEKMLKDDETFERGLNHTNSLYNLNKIFGSECEEFAIHRINRTCEWYNGIEIKRKPTASRISMLAPS